MIIARRRAVAERLRQEHRRRVRFFDQAVRRWRRQRTQLAFLRALKRARKGRVTEPAFAGWFTWAEGHVRTGGLAELVSQIAAGAKGQAVRILKTWRDTVDDSPWVFPSSRKKGPHIAHAQKAIEWIVRASGVNFRGHDLRRTAASLMVGAGVPRLVVSKILNHVETGATAVHVRHGDDLEKRAALDFWGKRLDQIVSGKRSKVLLRGPRVTRVCRYACSGIQ